MELRPADGRNRLDAIELAGFNTTSPPRRGTAHRRRKGYECGLDLGLGGVLADELAIRFVYGIDPYTYVYSRNLFRRHLTPEKRTELITKIIARAPEKSDRQIGKEIGADHKTVGKARRQGEDVGTIPHIEKRTDAQGRKQPARRRRLARETKRQEPPAPTTALVWETGKKIIGNHRKYRARARWGIYAVRPFLILNGDFGGYTVTHLPDANFRDGRRIGSPAKTADQAKAVAQEDHDREAKRQTQPAPADDLDIPEFLRREHAVVVTDGGEVTEAPTEPEESRVYRALLDLWRRAPRKDQLRFATFIGGALLADRELSDALFARRTIQ